MHLTILSYLLHPGVKEIEVFFFFNLLQIFFKTGSIIALDFPVMLVVKNQPANTGYIELQIWSLSCEDPLEEGVPTHSSILA